MKSTKIGYQLKRLSEKEAKEISTWRYPKPWDVYNMPSWEEIQKNGWDLGNPVKRKEEYMAFLSEGILVGYGRLFPAEKYVLLGIGLKPELCSKGQSAIWMPMMIETSKKRHPNLLLALEVRTFNIRAIKCYHKFNFQIIGTYERNTFTGPDTFYFMKHISK